MKITKEQLKKIIKEELAKEAFDPDEFRSYDEETSEAGVAPEDWYNSDELQIDPYVQGYEEGYNDGYEEAHNDAARGVFKGRNMHSSLSDELQIDPYVQGYEEGYNDGYEEAHNDAARGVFKGRNMRSIPSQR